MSAVFNNIDDAIAELEIRAKAHVEDKDNQFRKQLPAMAYDMYKELFVREYVDLAKIGITEEWDKHVKPGDSWDATRWLKDEHPYYVLAADVVCASTLWGAFSGAPLELKINKKYCRSTAYATIGRTTTNATTNPISSRQRRTIHL